MVYVLPVGLGDDLSEVSDTLPLHPSCVIKSGWVTCQMSENRVIWAWKVIQVTSVEPWGSVCPSNCPILIFCLSVISRRKGACPHQVCG